MGVTNVPFRRANSLRRRAPHDHRRHDHRGDAEPDLPNVILIIVLLIGVFAIIAVAARG
jgi:hypothetical protein